MQTVAILPVKRFASAKRRLEDALPSGSRRALAEAMFTDVLTALRRVTAIDDVLVVTADPGAQRIAEGYGARALEDPAEGGQDLAIARAVAVATDLGATQIFSLPGDCPLLDPLEIEALLGAPRAAERFAVIVADRHGTGTNGLLLSPPDALQPRYGIGSFQRHVDLAREAGIPIEVAEAPSLALDVDTPEDLAALQEALAARRGGAAHTRGMLYQLQRTSALGR